MKLSQQQATDKLFKVFPSIRSFHTVAEAFILVDRWDQSKIAVQKIPVLTHIKLNPIFCVDRNL